MMEVTPAPPVRVGDLLGDSYCGGAFELSAWDYLRVEAVGSDWIVVRGTHEAAGPQFYCGDIDYLIRQYRVTV